MITCVWVNIMLLWRKNFQDLIHVVVCLVSGTRREQNYQWYPFNALTNYNNNWKYTAALETLKKLWKSSFNLLWRCCSNKRINRSLRWLSRRSTSRRRRGLLSRSISMSCRWSSMSSVNRSYSWCRRSSINRSGVWWRSSINRSYSRWIIVRPKLNLTLCLLAVVASVELKNTGKSLGLDVIFLQFFSAHLISLLCHSLNNISFCAARGCCFFFALLECVISSLAHCRWNMFLSICLSRLIGTHNSIGS